MPNIPKRVAPLVLAFALAASAVQQATAQETSANAAEDPAQRADLPNEPGFFDLAGIDGWFDEEPWLEVNVKGALLRLVTEASRGEDPELTSILEKLKAIEVRGYPMTRAQFDDVGRRAGTLARELEDRGWETVLRVREDEQRANILMNVQGDVIAGLVVMVLEPDDEDGAVFVNIVGDIDPEQIGKIGRKFNIDPLSGSF